MRDDAKAADLTRGSERGPKSEEQGRADVALLFLPRRGLAREVLEPGDLLWRTVRPSFECLPVLGWDGDDPPFEDVHFRGIERFAANEVAEVGACQLGRSLQQGALF